MINGQIAWQHDEFSAELGKSKFGRLLRPIDIDTLSLSKEQEALKMKAKDIAKSMEKAA